MLFSMMKPRIKVLTLAVEDLMTLKGLLEQSP